VRNQQAHQTGSGARVYLVEDSPVILQLLTERIEALGATVIGHADTASMAISDISILQPDVVTLDIRLKAGTGFDVLEGIEINHEGELPLRIMLTNYATTAYRDAAHRLGVDHFFDKARQLPEMLALVASVEPHAELRGPTM
jgi:CheY-like chemotaxis protein